MGEDGIRLADGSEGMYGVVEKPDVAVIAAAKSGQVVMLAQYKYPVHARLCEFPQGSWSRGGSAPLAPARAELLEETGLRARSVEHICDSVITDAVTGASFGLLMLRGLL